MKDVLNLNVGKQLNEVSATELASQMGRLKMLVGSVTGNYSLDGGMSVQGTNGQIQTLITALSNEKKYLNTQTAARKHGLNRAYVYRDKARLDRAIKNFERETGIPWPVR
jgi:hypothetical protein